jgi:hypothetical protein
MSLFLNQFLKIKEPIIQRRLLDFRFRFRGFLLCLRVLRGFDPPIATNGGSIPGKRNRGCVDAMIVFGYADTRLF